MNFQMAMLTNDEGFPVQTAYCKYPFGDLFTPLGILVFNVFELADMMDLKLPVIITLIAAQLADTLIKSV